MEADVETGAASRISCMEVAIAQAGDEARQEIK